MVPYMVLSANGKAYPLEGFHEAFEVPRSMEKPGFLFISPHDDDAAIGAGMVLMRAIDHGVDVHIAIVTDGRMGYEQPEEQGGIVERRRRETIAAYNGVGVPVENIHFLGFPDADTWSYIGRRVAVPGDPVIAGHTGMTNAITHVIRQVRPEVVFVACGEDLHPDHKAVNLVTTMCIGHASSGIWSELGELHRPAALYEYAVYRRPERDPNLGFFGGEDEYRLKMELIGRWVSQSAIIAEIMGK